MVLGPARHCLQLYLFVMLDPILMKMRVHYTHYEYITIDPSSHTSSEVCHLTFEYDVNNWDQIPPKHTVCTHKCFFPGTSHMAKLFQWKAMS